MEDFGTLMKRKRDKINAHKKAALQGRVDDTLAAIDAAKKDKVQLTAAASKLRQRVESLKTMAADLERERSKYDAHYTEQKQRRDARSKPIEGNGMLDFARGCGDEQMRHTHKGRHLRRTGYCVKYDNSRVLGPSEFVLVCERQQRAQTMMEGRINNATTSAIAATSSSGCSDQQLSVRPKHNRTFAASPLQDMHYHGSSSLPDLEGYRGKSLRRTRHYYDYEGKMISMDPCDWPTHNGFVFIGM